jgi:hypothetical protein
MLVLLLPAMVQERKEGKQWIMRGRVHAQSPDGP